MPPIEYNKKNRRGGRSIETNNYHYKEIVAMEPVYGSAGGNATRIYTREGKTHLDSRRILAVLRCMVGFFDADLDRLRKNYRAHLGCRLATPLPLTPRLVLVPIKMRSGISGNDGATGYISLIDCEKITAVKPSAEKNTPKCLIHLKGNHTLPSLYSLENTEKRLLKGRQAQFYYCSIKNNNSNYGEELKMKPANDEVIEKVLLIAALYYELFKSDKPSEEKPDIISKWLLEKAKELSR